MTLKKKIVGDLQYSSSTFTLGTLPKLSVRHVLLKAGRRSAHPWPADGWRWSCGCWHDHRRCNYPSAHAAVRRIEDCPLKGGTGGTGGSGCDDGGGGDGRSGSCRSRGCSSCCCCGGGVGLRRRDRMGGSGDVTCVVVREVRRGKDVESASRVGDEVDVVELEDLAGAGEAPLDGGEEGAFEASELGGREAADAGVVRVGAERVAVGFGGEGDGGDDEAVHGQGAYREGRLARADLVDVV